MDQLMEMLEQEKAKVTLDVKDGDVIRPKDGVVIIPCINTANREDDVKKSLNAAKLG